MILIIQFKIKPFVFKGVFMNAKVSIGGINCPQAQKLRAEIFKTMNGTPEATDDYLKLIRLARQYFDGKRQGVTFQHKNFLNQKE
jgi:hypothetical protein